MNVAGEPAKNLLDVTGIPLNALLSADRNSALPAAVRRIVDEVVSTEFHIQVQMDADDGD